MSVLHSDLARREMFAHPSHSQNSSLRYIPNPWHLSALGLVLLGSVAFFAKPVPCEDELRYVKLEISVGVVSSNLRPGPDAHNSFDSVPLGEARVDQGTLRLVLRRAVRRRRRRRTLSTSTAWRSSAEKWWTSGRWW